MSHCQVCLHLAPTPSLSWCPFCGTRLRYDAEVERDSELMRAASCDGGERWVRNHAACVELADVTIQIRYRPLRLQCPCGEVFKIEGEA